MMGKARDREVEISSVIDWPLKAAASFGAWPQEHRLTEPERLTAITTSAPNQPRSVENVGMPRMLFPADRSTSGKHKPLKATVLKRRNERRLKTAIIGITYNWWGLMASKYLTCLIGQIHDFALTKHQLY